jgi:hypothetical protein
LLFFPLRIDEISDVISSIQYLGSQILNFISETSENGDLNADFGLFWAISGAFFAEKPEKLLEIGENVRKMREKWAEIGDFGENCGENGAKMPKNARKMRENLEKIRAAAENSVENSRISHKFGKKSPADLNDYR